VSRTDELVPVLEKLRLSGVLQSLDVRLRQAVEENLDSLESLFRLLTDEVERREAKQLRLRLSRASFDGLKSIDGCAYSFTAGLIRPVEG